MGSPPQATGLPLALDAMGGDLAPRAAVEGGVLYARETGRRVLLVGREDEVVKALREVQPGDAPVEVVHAGEVIGFGEKIASIRSKRDSSIHVGTRLVRDGRASAFVSAGHTGAMMAISKVVYGVVEGVERPALPAPIPRPGEGTTVLLDAGANLDCKAGHLCQFAAMGYHYSRRIFGVAEPRVALLSIGEEDGKGTELGREAAAILRETPLNFIGNVEGNDLFSDRADVVVCDGFVGNVALKVAEGIAEGMLHILKRDIMAGFTTRIGGLLLKPVFRGLLKKTDYAEYGGVPLLGLRYTSIVAHGRSSAKAIKNALRAGEAAAASRMVEMIADEIATLHAAEQRLGARVAP